MLASFLFVSKSQAAISFTNGKWETTYNCSEWEDINGTQQVQCDNIDRGGAWFCTTNGEHRGEQITTAANNPSGLGGRGQRFWQGDTEDDGNDTWNINVNSGGTILDFATPQKELWIRWYMRYESGWSYLTKTLFDHNYLYILDKILYIYTNTAGNAAIPSFYMSHQMNIGAQASPDAYQVDTGNFGWEELFGGINPSDGSWHEYEIHIKMDTLGQNGTVAGADGIGEIWVDGILRASNRAVNWSNGDAVAKNGWSWMRIGSNTKHPINNKCDYNDYDDMVIYNATPPNKDTNNNAFIGLIGATSVPSTFSISNFNNMIPNWLRKTTSSDLNSDNIVNTKDLGLMMNKWQ